MIYRLIPPDRLKSSLYPKEGEYTQEQLEEFNAQGFNIYYFPNHPSIYDPKIKVEGSQINVFSFVFVDMDLKDNEYPDKQAFLDRVYSDKIKPTFVIDSGRGIHVYWQVQDLDAMSYLKLQRRLCRYYKTDEAVSKIAQLMRVPGTVNTKDEDNLILCQTLYNEDISYTCDQLDDMLPPITHSDEEYCKAHYDRIYNTSNKNIEVDDSIPLKFHQLVRNSPEVKEIWSGNTDDRSKGDYRLGHIMFAHQFTREEARSVLVNSAKALSRSPIHRIGYAEGIIDKIWTFETQQDTTLSLSNTVRDILVRAGNTLKGTRFPCHRYLDSTAHGFRLGQVIGLVAGSGVGKTAMALNMFEGFVQNNPDYEHFFVTLEQPSNEIADRWQTMCSGKEYLYDKVHVVSNYSDDGTFRHLSFDEIKDYILKFQEVTKKKVGCVVIDHIGALKKKDKNEENQNLMDICHQMKAFAVQTNTMLVMQSQAPREKAGIGDLELNKDAAYGTVYFESYCDYLITIWQPLKRCYMEEGCPTVTAFKFCKIRHKKKGVDKIQEDVCYRLVFDPTTERMKETTQEDEEAFKFWLSSATNKRKLDRKTDIIPYQSTITLQEDVLKPLE